MRIYVDGAVTRTFEATGPRSEVITVPDNDGAHTAALEVCNEAGACSRSTDKSVQTYGPLRDEHIIEVQPLVQGTEVRWRITVDTNGDSAQVRVTSNRGRAETLAVNGVDVNTVLTTYRDIGYSTTETVTVTLSDTSPTRGPVSRQATSPATADPPPPTVSLQRGSRCNDRTNNPSCNTGAGGIDCVHASCGRIQITTTNFTTSRATCRIYDNVDGQWSTKTIDTNRSVEPGSYFGYPQRSVWAICDGTESNHYNWPNS